MSGAPKPIRHGTNAGYQQHRRRSIPPCEPCREARNAYDTRRRRERGTPARIAGPYTSIPTAALGELYLNATLTAQAHAEAQIPADVLKLAVDFYDKEVA